MSEIEIKGVDYNIPDCWEELTFGKFLDYYQWLKRKGEIDGVDYTIGVISSISDCPKDILEDLVASDYVELNKLIQWLKEYPTDKKTDIIIIDKVKYVYKDYNLLNRAEMKTLEFLLADLEDNTIAYPQVLAILLRPAIKYKNSLGKTEYKQCELDERMEDIFERAELFKQKLMMSEIYGPLVFFSTGEKGSFSKNSGQSSTLKIKSKKVVS